MTESEKMKHEAELKAAYLQGFKDARHFPNRQAPKVVRVSPSNTLVPDWNAGLPKPIYLEDVRPPA